MRSRVATVGVRIVGAVFIAIGIVLLVASYGPLQNLWAEYQDSPASTYIAFGGLMIVFGLAFAAAGVHLWRSSR